MVFSEHGLQPGTGAVHNVQRPETFEALFVLWRVTGKPMYREWAWSIFQSFDRECKVRCVPEARSQSWLHDCGCAAMSGCTVCILLKQRGTQATAKPLWLTSQVLACAPRR